MRRPAAFGLALGLAACGIKGAPPRKGAPAPVSDLRVEGRDGGVRISWRGRTAGGVKSFDVLRRLDADGKERTFFEKIGTLDRAGNRRYEIFDRALVAGERYEYRVRPRRDDPAGTAVRYTGPQGEFTWEEPLDPPTGVKSQPLNAGTRLTWDVVPGADGYRVYQLVAAGGAAKGEPNNRGLIDNTSWVAVALPDGKPVCYVVRAVKLPEKREDVPPARPLDEEEAP